MTIRAGKFLSGQDIYGHKIGVHYDGESEYKTRFGGLVTLATYVFVIINTFNLVTVDFVNREGQVENQRNLYVDLLGMDPFDLEEHQFDVSVTSSLKIPADYG